jgi:hypothetical protein
MKKEECRMKNPIQPDPSGSRSVSFCILHSDFCISI